MPRVFSRAGARFAQTNRHTGCWAVSVLQKTPYPPRSAARAGASQPREIVLGSGIALVGSLAKPPRRLRVVLRDAPALVVQDAEIVLGSGIALVGSLAIPPRRLRVVPHDALASVVQGAEKELGVGIALLGERTKNADRGRVISTLPGTRRLGEQRRACWRWNCRLGRYGGGRLLLLPFTTRSNHESVPRIIDCPPRERPKEALAEQRVG